MPDQQGVPSAAELMQSVGSSLEALNQAISQAPNVPDEIKQSMQQSLDSFMRVVEALTGGAAGNQQGGPMPMEQGQQPSQLMG